MLPLQGYLKAIGNPTIHQTLDYEDPKQTIKNPKNSHNFLTLWSDPEGHPNALRLILAEAAKGNF